MTSFMQIHCVMCSNILLYFFGRAFHWIAISITSVLSDLFYLNISTKVIVATENSGCPAPYYRSWEYFRPLAGVYLRGVWRQGRPEWLLGRGSPSPGGGRGRGCGERPRACIQGLGPKSELVSRSPANLTLKLYHAICTSLMNWCHTCGCIVVAKRNQQIHIIIY